MSLTPQEEYDAFTWTEESDGSRKCCKCGRRLEAGEVHMVHQGWFYCTKCVPPRPE